jgi:tRNA (guanine37-N1)-methyltransferase
LRSQSLLNLLKDKLSPEELQLVYQSYDIIGDIAIIRVLERLKGRSIIIAETLMRFHKPVRAVWRQSGAVSGEFRLRDLEYAVGEKRAVTTHKEHGSVFRVDLLNCYFSPRLAYERMRIARLVEPNEVVVNMFAGVGSFSIIIAKHSQAERIYSIDINPMAFEYMQENVFLNNAVNRVIPLKGDAKTVILERLENTADRVLMPLPEKAYEYLDYAVAALKPNGGWIHYYDFEHVRKDENSISKVKSKVSQKLSQLNLDFSLPFGRVVRGTGPRWQQIVVDIQIRRKTQLSTNLLCLAADRKHSQ